MTNLTNLTKMALSLAAIAAMTGCGDTSINYGDSTVAITGDTLTTGTTGGTTGTTTPPAPSTQETVIGNITTDTTWTADKAWILDGYVSVTNGATLTIEPGTRIAGKNSDSYLLIDKNAKIIADGTAEKPIIFSSVDGLSGTDTTVGKWGGVTLIGNANMSSTPLTYEVTVNGSYTAGTGVSDDSSGILRHVKILNSATETGLSQETNGLSMVGVGSGTVVEDITVDYSNDDGIEIWGGTVNMTNVTISHCTDDHLDVDSMYQGTVKNLVINATMGYAGIEMSGTDTVLTVDGFTITVDGFAIPDSAEGGIFFKKSGVGGKFYNGTIIYRSASAGAIYSQQDAKLSNIDFNNVGIYTDIGNTFVNKTDAATDSADEIKNIFTTTGSGNNDDACVIPSTTITGKIAGCNVLTRGKSWVIDQFADTAAGASIRIQDGTTIGGNDANSYLQINKDSKIYALGTETAPITFTDKAKTNAQEGLWGGLTLIGNANMSSTPLTYEVTVNGSYTAGTGVSDDSSGILRHVKILNSATETGLSQETNGLSMVGVGSGTVVEDITVDYSNDDGIEIWGGTVNMTNVTISHCTDDHLDVDSMYQGTVKNLVINATMGYAGIEMSGTDTVLTLDGFTINHDSYAAGVGEFEGGIYFKKAGVGGKFYNGTINYNSIDGAAIYSAKIPKLTNIDFGNVTINTVSGDFEDQTDPTTDGADEIRAIFDANTSNTINYL
ncbi:hypothetical protein [Sulfurovum sp. TSL1]|uniref:hypothetical protein n=1 Tax=Sulfurovum sp. TSL1 TaxID=2826994 RepID=UPI001CC5D881|nr:hypothetical protein [Sulfurovum sp. TSL1]GIT98753.1 hypothetical protein TSL1_15740 [Sulfurovum sp. TSL1]